MNDPPSSFIPMLPRWRLPLTAPSHARRIQHRMSASSSSDSEQSLTRLRNMQRAILKRRSRLQEQLPKPPVVPRNEGLELAEALFPEVQSAVLNPNQAEAGRNEPSEEHQERKEMGEGEMSGARKGHDTAGPIIGERMDESPYPPCSSTTVDATATIQGGWYVTASTRSRNAESLDASSLPSKGEDPATTDPRGETTATGFESSSPPSDDYDGIVRGVWRKEASKRARTRTDAPSLSSIRTPTVSDAAARMEAASEITVVPGRGLDPGVDSVAGKVVELDMSKLLVSRKCGSLPWKSPEKQKEATQSAVLVELLELPKMSVFTSDQGWSRKNWRLPRCGLVQFDTKRATDKDVSTSDCNAILEGLNGQQIEAVLADPTKACLVLAGPGSGKTRVLTHRVAYLVKKYNVSPYQILAVTFTNKAAEEMKERVSKLLQLKFAPDWTQDSGPRLSMGTFHSISARILRKHGDAIGIASDFVICDTSESRQVIGRLLKRFEGSSPDSSTVSEAVSGISKLKNDQDEKLRKKWPQRVYKRIAELRALYDQELRSMNQLDFDDLLLETRKLLQSSPEVRNVLQDTYEHVLVDEWQDTNHVQFDLVSLLAGRNKNLFAVGDADQSIYKFRGADSGNLERFTETYPNAAKIALEQNYRSSACIVAAAQSVIEANTKRPSKKMVTLNEFGSKITLRETYDDRQESQYVVSELNRLLREKTVTSHSDVAIMYRTNAQSRLIEEYCIQSDIPYRLLSGTKFYDRQEVRDLVAYLRILSNPADDNAFRRIVNTPPRGIGKKTQEELEKFCESRQIPLLKGLDELLASYAADGVSGTGVELGKAAVLKLAEFGRVVNGLQKKSREFLSDTSVNGSETESVDVLLTAVLQATDYKQYLQKRDSKDNGHSEKAMERLGNVDELVRAASRHTNLHQYLEGVTLMVDTMHRKEEQEGESPTKSTAVSLMTLHGGKGLEFGAVFIIGVEDSVIPISRGGDVDLEEERRLFYVGMTRAKQQLYITWRLNKLVLQGGKAYSRESVGPSRFLEDIPSELVNRVETSSSKWKRRSESDKAWSGPTRRKASGSGRTRSSHERKTSEEDKSPVVPMTQWRAGDSVRCGAFGRGTVTIGAPGSEAGAWIEVLFADGSRHFVNTVAQDVELLFSPAL